MGDATMDAVQKRLMFEDEFVPNPFFLIDTTFFFNYFNEILVLNLRIQVEFLLCACS